MVEETWQHQEYYHLARRPNFADPYLAPLCHLCTVSRQYQTQFFSKTKNHFGTEIDNYLCHFLVIALVEGIVAFAVNFKGQFCLIDSIWWEANLQHAVFDFNTTLKKVLGLLKTSNYQKNCLLRGKVMFITSIKNS